MRVKKLFCSLFFLGIATCSLQKANATTNSSINSFAIDQEKFEEFLNDTENSKWWKIANAGRDFAFKNFNNDRAVESLIDVFHKIS